MMSVDNNVVGFCGFKDEPQDSEVEIGYNVSPYKQGRGFAKLAVNQLCQLAFNVDSIESVVALISSAKPRFVECRTSQQLCFHWFCG